MKRFFSHLPAWVDALASGTWRAAANMSAMACSAVVIELPKGVFMTTTPFAVAAGMSTLSTPMPARPMTLRFFAAAMTSAFTLVAERMASPSYRPMISLSLAASGPTWGRKSTSMPRDLKMSIAAWLSSSLMSTLGMGGVLSCARRGARGQEFELRICWRAWDASGGLGCEFGRERFEGPVHPWTERFDIGRFDRAAAPDAQARRRRAIGAGVVGDAFLFQKRGELLGELGLSGVVERGHARIDHFEADAGV